MQVVSRWAMVVALSVFACGLPGSDVASGSARDMLAISVLANSSAECASSAVKLSPVSPVMGAYAVPLRLRLASCPLV